MKRTNGLRALDLSEEEDIPEESGQFQELERRSGRQPSPGFYQVLWKIKSFIFSKEVILGTVCAVVLVVVLFGLGAYYLTGSHQSASTTHHKVTQTKSKSSKSKTGSVHEQSSKATPKVKTNHRKSAFPVQASKDETTTQTPSTSSDSSVINASSDYTPAITPSAQTDSTSANPVVAQSESSELTTPSEQPVTYQPSQPAPKTIAYEHVVLNQFIGKPYKEVVKSLTELGATVVVNFVLAAPDQQVGTVIDIKGENTTATLTVAWKN